MLEKAKHSAPDAASLPAGDKADPKIAASSGPSATPAAEIDNELQAAIEYKIASTGARGAEKVLDLLNAALRRLLP